MDKRLSATLVSALAAGVVMPLAAQSIPKLNFDIGGGVSTPLNPTAQYVGVTTKGTSAGGVNGGVGFTIRLGEQGWKFYVESRYHYAFSSHIPTTLVPVAFGIRYN